MAAGVLAASQSPLGADEDPVKRMLGDRNCDRLACATLLRLLVFDPEPFETDQRLRDSTALFDRALATPLYGEVDLTVKAQAYTKRDRLRTLVSSHEEELIGHVKSLGSLDAMSSFRQGFGKLFGAKATVAFVLPFLPAGITRQTFDELFGAVHGLAECTDASLIDRAEAVEARCRELTEQARQLGTTYAEVLLADLAENLQGLARDQVKAAGFSDPARLTVKLRPKRYPLREPGTPVLIRLDLENQGPGHAQEVWVEIEGGGAIEYDDTAKAIGQLGVGTRQIQFQGTVVGTASPGDGASPGLSDVLMIRASWRNPDRSEQQIEEIATLEEQPGDVSWGELALEQPYQLEPVTDPRDFVGRELAVRDLAKVVLRLGNARIQGEKRVGKTSLAYAVSAAVKDQHADRYAFIHLESGDFNSHTPEGTVARIGELIVDRARKSDKRLEGLPTPDFGSGLSTVTEFFAAAYELAPDKAFVIVLDEFDALPHSSLYRHEPVGDAFFQTLRSLGGKTNLGFILIGGERMQWVIATHGQTLNKFKLVPLDYFTEDQMGDYAELVRAPVNGSLEFSDGAVSALYTASAGNPWMTKLLLSELFERQVERHDRDVQADDVADAITHALPKFSAASFQHFWDDAIRGDVDDREYVSSMRRRVFLALGRCLKPGTDSSEDAVVTQARDFNVDEPTAREVIRGLLDRSILVLDEQGSLACRVPLFERWLAKYGAQEIVLGSGDDDTLIRRQRSAEEMRPTHEELAALAKRWRSYRGEDVHPDRIEAWLDQFGGFEEQRLVMPILEELNFFTRSRMDESMRNLHQFVLRELASRGYEYTISGQQRFRNDFLVCGLEGGGSGAAHLVKRYRDENGIYSDCAVDAVALRDALDNAKQEIRAVIVLEDFIGTGATASARLKELHPLWTLDSPWPEGVDVFVLAICGFEQGIKRAQRVGGQLEWPLTLRVDETLSDADRCFHKESRFYPEPSTREQAQALCARFGAMLSAKKPLGFGDTEAAVCFEYRCPNNSLPVLWAEAPNWQPLFQSLYRCRCDLGQRTAGTSPGLSLASCCLWRGLVAASVDRDVGPRAMAPGESVCCTPTR
jgi:hypothetical protein